MKAVKLTTAAISLLPSQAFAVSPAEFARSGPIEKCYEEPVDHRRTLALPVRVASICHLSGNRGLRCRRVCAINHPNSIDRKQAWFASVKRPRNGPDGKKFTATVGYAWDDAEPPNGGVGTVLEPVR